MGRPLIPGVAGCDLAQLEMLFDFVVWSLRCLGFVDLPVKICFTCFGFMVCVYFWRVGLMPVSGFLPLGWF